MAQLSWSATANPEDQSSLPTFRLNLRETMATAAGQNPIVQLFQERFTQAQELSKDQLGELLPNLSGRMSWDRSLLFFCSFGRDPVIADPDRLYETRALLTQKLFSLNLIHKCRAAKAGVDGAGLDAEVTRPNTRATVGLMYLKTLRAQDTVEARETDATSNHELVMLTAQRRTADMATLLYLNRAPLGLQNERQRWLVAKNDLTRARSNSIRTIGLSFDVNLILTDEVSFGPFLQQSMQNALEGAQDHRTELKLQKQKERLAAITLSSIVSKRKPSLQASRDVGLIGNEVSKMLSNDNIPVLMSFPILIGGNREGRISESRSRVRQEEITTRDASYQISLEVRDAYFSLYPPKGQVKEAEEGFALSLKEVELAGARFAAGLANSIEVTEAQTALAQEEIMSLKRYLI